MLPESENQAAAAAYQEVGVLISLQEPGGWVVDFFAGSGTTGEAAVTQGRDAMLVELSPRWAGRRAIAAIGRGLRWGRRYSGFGFRRAGSRCGR